MQALYYSQHLYPFQDRILALVNRLDLGFYLTGGTALTRHYLQHRYSDDLDLFVNNSTDFKGLVHKLEDILQLEGIKYNVPTRGDDFVRMEAFSDSETRLIIDLVNDRVLHIGDFEASDQLGKVDNIINILSNKISALPRLEIKDFVDVAFIARNYQFSWEEIIGDAAQNDVWVNPIDVSRYFSTTDPKLFSKIHWISPVIFEDLSSALLTISNDILEGAVNSLYTKHCPS